MVCFKETKYTSPGSAGSVENPVPLRPFQEADEHQNVKQRGTEFLMCQGQAGAYSFHTHEEGNDANELPFTASKAARFSKALCPPSSSVFLSSHDTQLAVYCQTQGESPVKTSDPKSSLIKARINKPGRIDEAKVQDKHHPWSGAERVAGDCCGITISKKKNFRKQRQADLCPSPVCFT